MTITIITANWNSDDKLSITWDSLRNQTNGDFLWIIKDNYSTDGSYELAASLSELDSRISVVRSRDSGIYDALNTLVQFCFTDFYLVLGAEDTLSPLSIHEFHRDLQRYPECDLFFYGVSVGKKINLPMRHFGFLYGLRGCGSSHSVGSLIRRSLHDSHGMYKVELSLLADQLFIKTCLYNGAKAMRSIFNAGAYALGGKSELSPKEFRKQFYYVQCKTERFLIIQKVLFIIRSIFRPHR